LLPHIVAPTLVVSGTEDRPIPPERARAVHAAIAGSRFIAVANAGHAVMIERPALFNDLLENLLSGVEDPVARVEP
jgi:pimeloyl-ACP methyl ester carboxylesterase